MSDTSRLRSWPVFIVALVVVFGIGLGIGAAVTHGTMSARVSSARDADKHAQQIADQRQRRTDREQRLADANARLAQRQALLARREAEMARLRAVELAQQGQVKSTP
jgi:hypothetical protein